MLLSFFSISNRDQRGSVRFWRAALDSALQHLGPCPGARLEFLAAELPPGCLSLILFPLSLSQITSCCMGIFLVPTKMLQFAGIHRDQSPLRKLALPPSSSAG